MPTTHDLQLLADEVARTGTTAQNNALDQIADVTEASGLYDGAAAVLRDADAPEAMRSRAFMTIARNWSEIRAAAQRWAMFRSSFDALAAQADEHHRLRASGDLNSLWDSRAKLEALRVETAMHRVCGIR